VVKKENINEKKNGVKMVGEMVVESLVLISVDLNDV